MCLIRSQVAQYMKLYAMFSGYACLWHSPGGDGSLIIYGFFFCCVPPFFSLLGGNFIPMLGLGNVPLSLQIIVKGPYLFVPPFFVGKGKDTRETKGELMMKLSF